MPNFLNTRPTPRVKDLTKGLKQAGIAVTELPLMEIQPIKMTQSEQTKLNQLNQYDIVFGISPTAISGLCDYLSAQSLIMAYQQSENISQYKPRFIAVGVPSQQVFIKYGIEADIPVQSSNEGLLAMNAVQQLKKGDSVLICRGLGGRRLLIDALKKRGVQVDSIAFYQRNKPTMLNTAINKVSPWATHVLISSGESWQNWYEACQINDIAIEHYHYIVLGNRLVNILKKTLYQTMSSESAIKQIHSIDSLQVADVVKVLME